MINKSKMPIKWANEAWNDYLYWQAHDRQTMCKINDLIKDSMRNGYKGIGKPEMLKGELSGFCSRRINHEDRFVYRIKNGELEVAQCKGHYDD